MDIEDVIIVARKHVQGVTAIHPMLDMPIVILSKEERNTSLVSLIETLDISASVNQTSQVLEIIIVLDIYLAAGGDNERKNSDHDAAIFVRQWVAGAILPSEAFAEPSPYSTKEKVTLTADEIAKFHAMSLSGILLLARLHNIEPSSKKEHLVTILTCLASFTDLSDPWTCSKASDHAFSLLRDYAASDNVSAAFTGLLEERIKPLFAKAQYPATTQQGRRFMDPISSSEKAHGDLDGDAKPWKYSDVYSVTVFQWVLKCLDELSLQANWPLIIPPLLALIDDTSIKYKVKGCNLLATFLQQCPSLLLERTGLGDVFENAVMPCLLSLPSLTEEAESLEMLKAAYPALMSLALVRFPGEKHQSAKVKALDKILRDGVLKGYVQAGEHVRIGKLLVNEMAIIVKEMGIESVRYLKHILPLLAGILAAPFATACPALLQASVKLVQIIIVIDWPRIAHHRGEILKGLTICWYRIRDEETQSQELKALRKNVEQTVQHLTYAMTLDSEFVDEYQTLIDSDSRLRELLLV